MRIYFNQANLKFESMGRTKFRLEKISHLIFDILEEKVESFMPDSGQNERSKDLYFENVTIDPIKVDSSKSDYSIASSCASSIYREMVKKLQ